MSICLVGMASIASAVYFQFKSARLRKRDVNYRRALTLLNVLFQPSLYTDEAQPMRKRCMLGVLGFLLCWAVGIVFGLTTGVAH